MLAAFAKILQGAWPNLCSDICKLQVAHVVRTRGVILSASTPDGIEAVTLIYAGDVTNPTGKRACRRKA